MKTERLLLHACCAPCLSYPHELLKNSYDLTVFYANDNIHPVVEYQRRLAELTRFASGENIPLVTDGYNPKDWFAVTRDFRFRGERSERCRECFRYRLDRVFRYALAEGFPMVGTVLTVSPHKDAALINIVGEELSRCYGIPFLQANFKKRGGFKRSLELSRVHGFYRQDYCGCVWSREERKKDSMWKALRDSSFR